jgi:TonB-dependent starch-binding outer membrane protein SusC
MKKNLLLTLLICVLPWLGNSAMASDGIKTQNEKILLSELLESVSKYYKINIVYDASEIQNVKADKLAKYISVEEDLTFILKNSNHFYQKISSYNYVLKKKQAKALKSLKNNDSKEEFINNSQTNKQEVKIFGTIIDGEDKQPVIGAIVRDINTEKFAVADLDGKYELSTTVGNKIEVSGPSYANFNFDVTKGGEYNVTLGKADLLIDEVVVVGYGSQKKSDLTGAISTIGVKELKQLPVTGLEQAMQGRSAGVYITQNSGSPGGAMSIRIRGTGSTLSAEPLYVIDGIPIVNDNRGTSSTFESDGGGQYSNALTTINPNDIESIEILKDASATAIYGARAANGVVLITTKKGGSGKKSIAYETYFGVQQLYKKVPVMSLLEYAKYIKETTTSDIEEFEDLDLLGEGTDWQDVIFRPATMNNHQFSVIGGNESTSFSITAGTHLKNGIVEGSQFQRYSSKINVDHNFSKKLKLGSNILLSRTRENITFNDNSNGVIYTALLTPPMVASRTLDGAYGSPPSGNNIVLQFNNPLASATEVEDVNRKLRALASVYGEVALTPYLTYRAELATDLVYANHNTFSPAYQRGTLSSKSRVRRNINSNSFWINKHLLTFNKKYDKHAITMLGGFEAQEGKYEWLNATRDNLPNNLLRELTLGDAGTQQVNGGAGHWALLSYFGRLNYGFNDKYLFTGTLRADGSSRFGENNKYGLFPSFAFAWRASQENFLKKFSNISNLKTRIGYGAVGNQEIGLYSFASLLRSQDVVVGNQLLTGFTQDNISNPNVKWESSIQINTGLDIGLFNNRVELVIDAYKKISKDMLLPAIYPATAGSLASPFINIGKMENTGVEFTLNTQNLAGKFGWKTSANVSINRNNVVDLGSTGSLTGVVQRVPVTRTEEGRPIGQFFGHKMIGIFKDLAEIDASPFQESGTRPGDVKFADLNGDKVINEKDKTFIGSPHPDFTLNVINEFNYKNFDLNVFLRGVYGNEAYNLLRRDIAGTGAWHNQSRDVLNRWTPTNPEGTEPRSNGNDPNQNRRVSDRFVEDASYLRLQNVVLGYNLPKSVYNRFKMTNFRIYASGQNLFTISKYSGYDPEIGAYNQSPLISGVDNGRFPVARSLTIGANVNF